MNIKVEEKNRQHSEKIENMCSRLDITMSAIHNVQENRSEYWPVAQGTKIKLSEARRFEQKMGQHAFKKLQINLCQMNNGWKTSDKVSKRASRTSHEQLRPNNFSCYATFIAKTTCLPKKPLNLKILTRTKPQSIFVSYNPTKSKDWFQMTARDGSRPPIAARRKNKWGLVIG